MFGGESNEEIGFRGEQRDEGLGGDVLRECCSQRRKRVVGRVDSLETPTFGIRGEQDDVCEGGYIILDETRAFVLWSTECKVVALF